MIDTITALKQSASESVDKLASKAYSLLDEIEALEAQVATLEKHMGEDLLLIHELKAQLEDVTETLMPYAEGYPESTPNAVGQLVSTEPQPADIAEYVIKKLEAQLAEAIKWIQHDCPFDSKHIRNTLENQFEKDDMEWSSRVDEAPIYTNMDRWVTISVSRFRELEQLEAQLDAVQKLDASDFFIDDRELAYVDGWNNCVEAIFNKEDK